MLNDIRRTGMLNTLLLMCIFIQTSTSDSPFVSLAVVLVFGWVVDVVLGKLVDRKKDHTLDRLLEGLRPLTPEERDELKWR